MNESLEAAGLGPIFTAASALGAISIMVQVILSVWRWGREDELRLSYGWTLASLALVFNQPIRGFIETLLSPENESSDVDAPQTPDPVPAGDSTTIDLPDVSGLVPWLAVLLLGGAAIAGAWVMVARVQRARRAARKRASEVAEKWRSIIDRHDELRRKVLRNETDWDTLFLYPALSDPSVPATYAMLTAMKAANLAQRMAPETLPVDVELRNLDYPQAVDDFEVAYLAAERHARRVGQHGIPASERRAIDQIRTLLAIAESEASSTNERQLAYDRVQALVRTLTQVVIPHAALALITGGRARLIEAAEPAVTVAPVPLEGQEMWEFTR